ncbi:hypothetical protein C8Q80DRAFT_1117480 [Daedaleopsis nitida]|nr:hypothetical protein C8Q80DRAFT_1117480 [Daedaleopsis nitida]
MAAFNPEIAAYANSMMRLQLDNQQLHDELRALKMQLAEYKAVEDLEKRRKKTVKGKAASTGSSRAVPNADADADDADDAAADDNDNDNDNEKSPSILGKSFVTMMELITPDILSYFKPAVLVQPKLNWDSPDRYVVHKGADYTRFDEGLLADLFHHVPESMHALMRSPKMFSRPFKKGVDDQRSQIASRVRALVGFIYPDLDSKIFLRGASVKVLHPDLAKCLKWDLTKKEYSMLPPILHLNLVRNRTGLLFNKSLVLILRMVLHGQTSITIPKGTRKGGTPPTNIKKWGVKKVTPGMIACAAVMAVHGCSPDDVFSAIGPVSQYNYRGLHLRIKRLLITMADSPWAKHVMDHFNAKLFGGLHVQPFSSAIEPDDNHNSDDDEKLMEELTQVVNEPAVRIDDEEEEEEEDSQGDIEGGAEPAPPESVASLSEEGEGDAPTSSDLEYLEPREVCGVPMSQDRSIIRGTISQHLALPTDDESSNEDDDLIIIEPSAPVPSLPKVKPSGSGATAATARKAAVPLDPIPPPTASLPKRKPSGSSAAAAASKAPSDQISPPAASHPQRKPSGSSVAAAVRPSGDLIPPPRAITTTTSEVNVAKKKPMPRAAGGKKKGKQPATAVEEQDKDLIEVEEEEPEPEPTLVTKAVARRTTPRSKAKKT